ncbi:MAG: hypothetical protein WDN44_10965 [Sphingomonas sp.]
MTIEQVEEQAPSAVATMLCQAPAILFASWWGAMFDAWLPPGRHGPSHPAAHDQLEVPEPIEAEGERALFA